MKTIETTISVSDDGSIHISPLEELAVGDYKAILIVEKIDQTSLTTERDQATAALRAAGLLAEPTQQMRDIAAASTLSLEEARAILDRAGGKPLSEVILDMRGPKN